MCPFSSRFAIVAALLVTVGSGNSAVGQHFTDVTDAVGATFTHQDPPGAMMMGGGMAWLDLDADGDDDLFLASSSATHRLLRNDGGMFTDITAGAGLPSGILNTMGTAVGDYDDDGYPDVYLTNRGADTLLRNLGDGTFADVTVALGLGDTGWGTSASWADFDRDGDLDLYVGTYAGVIDHPYHIGDPNRLYINEGTSAAPQFVDRAPDLGVDLTTVFGEPVPGWPNPKVGEPTAATTLSVCTVDYDDDGDPDLAIGNDFGLYIVPNKLFRNDTPVGGPLAFTDVSESTAFGRPQHNMGVNPCDYDRDGDWDFYLTDLGPNALLRNDGGVFTDVTEEAGPVEGWNPSETLKLTSWSTVWADVDNDGFEDLYVVNGHIPAGSGLTNVPEAKNNLWGNVGDGTFEVVEDSGLKNKGFGRGGAASDFDGDGWMDIALLNNGSGLLLGADQSSKLFRNEGTLGEPGAGWVQLRLAAVLSHGEALGARVDALVDGALMRRQVLADPVYASSKSRMLHFGLGGAGQIDVALIQWPSGTMQELHEVPSGLRLAVEEPVVTISSVVTPALTHGGVELAVRLVNADDVAHLSQVRFGLRFFGRSVFVEDVSVALAAGSEGVATLLVPVSSAVVQALHGLDLDLRVDVGAEGSRALDSRVVPVDF